MSWTSLLFGCTPFSYFCRFMFSRGVSDIRNLTSLSRVLRLYIIQTSLYEPLTFGIFHYHLIVLTDLYTVFLRFVEHKFFSCLTFNFWVHFSFIV